MIMFAIRILEDDVYNRIGLLRTAASSRAGFQTTSLREKPGRLEILLRVNEGHVEVLLAVASHNEAGETAADNEDLKKTRLSADLNIES